MIRLLLVEDNNDFASILMNELKHFIGGYEIVVANNGKEAIEQWKSFSPDIIASDISMPTMNGFQMAEIIRCIDLKVPIIFFTEFNTCENVSNSYEVGANFYLRKPFSVEEFDAHVKGILKKSDNYSSNYCYKIGSYIFYKRKFVLKHEPTNQEVRLTKMEADLLSIFISKLNEPILKDVFYHILWNPNKIEKSTANCLYKQINKLREYLEKDSNVQIISLSRIGYKLVVKTK